MSSLVLIQGCPVFTGVSVVSSLVLFQGCPVFTGVSVVSSLVLIQGCPVFIGVAVVCVYLRILCLDKLILLLFYFLQFDGCAYRGRVMVEVGVNIGTFPTHKRELIPKSDLEIIPVSCYGNAPTSCGL